MTPPVPFHVVGIGASAGGLQALEQFFDAMPAGGGIAFVVIQHLSPDFKSLMKELLGRHTSMQVHRAENDMSIEPGAVYLIPPQKNLQVADGRLKLTDQRGEGTRGPHFPVDVFFESLAEEYGDRAIAVVLSGTGSDGSRGVRAVAQANGVVFVQDLDSAQFDGMPRSAIAAAANHSVLPPDGIARAIYNYVARADDLEPHGEASQTLEDRSVINNIVSLLRRDGGVDFSHYRPATIARRVARRIALRRAGGIDDYLTTLSLDETERHALRNDLLIGVTSFFRDQPAWDLLRDRVAQKIVEAKAPNDVIRCWVSACSTGEEAFSMAITLLEAVRHSGKPLETKVFATDIDQRALEVAASGLYSASLVEALPTDIRAWYFLPEADGFRVSRRLRESVIFAEHNLIRDAPFTNMDIVSCRNTMIYMEPPLQKRVLGSLHFALREGGCLFLGAAETTGAFEEEFSPIESKWKLYTKRRDVRLTDPSIAMFGASMSVYSRRGALSPYATNSAKLPRTTSSLESAFRLLLQDRDSAALITDNEFQIAYAFGRTDRFIRVPEGAGTRDITKMVDPDLALALGSAMHQARGKTEAVTYSSLAIEEGRQVDLRVSHRSEESTGTEFFLVLFEEVDDDRKTAEAPRKFTVEEHMASRVRGLEIELQQSREGLQATIEELEATNEEHQATNEELLAANEQLQSTNEELQSVNEELHTVNSEHQTKIQELLDLNADLDNLLSTEIGTLFLDADMRIRKYSPFVLEIVQLADNDIGRNIHTFSHGTSVPDLWKRLAAVSTTKAPFETRLRTENGREVFLCGKPYVAPQESRHGDGGVMAMFIDLDLIRRAMGPQDTANGADPARATSTSTSRPRKQSDAGEAGTAQDS